MLKKLVHVCDTIFWYKVLEPIFPISLTHKTKQKDKERKTDGHKSAVKVP